MIRTELVRPDATIGAGAGNVSVFEKRKGVND